MSPPLTSTVIVYPGTVGARRGTLRGDEAGGLVTTIIEADVPRPLWDEWLDIMVVSPGLSPGELAAAVRRLLDERCGGGDGAHPPIAVG
jgi:hypothetical protein